jgi:hypothetical protein
MAPFRKKGGNAIDEARIGGIAPIKRLGRKGRQRIQAAVERIYKKRIIEPVDVGSPSRPRWRIARVLK